MKVFFKDVANSFLPHYFKLLAQGPDQVAPMYTETAVLMVNSTEFRGRPAILAELANLEPFDSVSCTHLSQPFKGDGILITAHVRSSSAAFVITYIFAIVSDQNQFAITHQVIHKSPS
jgi:hypothetical protein